MNFFRSDTDCFKRNGMNALNGDYENEFEYVQANVLMPRFEIGYTMDLRETLEEKPFEINDLFNDERAKLKKIGMGISGENIYISMARHKTFAKVDEQGFEGAAVTVLGGSVAESARDPKKITFKVDQPFFFVVRDRQNGNIPIF